MGILINPNTESASNLAARGIAEFFIKNTPDALAGAVECLIAATNPDSIFQICPEPRIHHDENSASKPARRHYYRWVFENSPSRQENF